jgi:hypothetical protein
MCRFLLPFLSFSLPDLSAWWLRRAGRLLDEAASVCITSLPGRWAGLHSQTRNQQTQPTAPLHIRWGFHSSHSVHA